MPDQKKAQTQSVSPGYLTWEGLASYSSCSKRWLQHRMPSSLRFRVGGKVLIKVEDFDRWMERHRQGQDLDQMLGELLGSTKGGKSRGG